MSVCPRLAIPPSSPPPGPAPRPAHHWEIEPLARDGAFPARCRHCHATRTFPVLDEPLTPFDEPFLFVPSLDPHAEDESESEAIFAVPIDVTFDLPFAPFAPFATAAAFASALGEAEPRPDIGA